MVVFPNCKINLGLHIRRKRADGYHDLETIFYPIEKREILEVIPSHNASFPLQQEGLSIEGAIQDNLVLKAYELLKKKCSSLPEVEFFLYKTIPSGAGLGGGSADGAFALKLLNDKFQLHLSEETLCEYALELGSDCPFFIKNMPSFATSRGEILSPISLDLKGYFITLINPRIHISTGWAFSQLQLNDSDSHFEEIGNQPIEKWKEILNNDFEPAVFQEYPIIKKLKEKLYEIGAIYASMSGTGSSCFGIFASAPDLDIFPKEYFRENYLL